MEVSLKDAVASLAPPGKEPANSGDPPADSVAGPGWHTALYRRRAEGGRPGSGRPGWAPKKLRGPGCAGASPSATGGAGTCPRRPSSCGCRGSQCAPARCGRAAHNTAEQAGVEPDGLNPAGGGAFGEVGQGEPGIETFHHGVGRRLPGFHVAPADEQQAHGRGAGAE